MIKKHDQYGFRCLVKLLTNTNNIRYIRITPEYDQHNT